MSAGADLALGEDERARILAKAALFAPPGPRLADGRRDLIGLSRDEMAAALAELDIPGVRVKQIWHWIYHRGVRDFARMSSIARPLQEILAARFVISRPEAARNHKSTDG